MIHQHYFRFVINHFPMYSTVSACTCVFSLRSAFKCLALSETRKFLIHLPNTFIRMYTWSGQQMIWMDITVRPFSINEPSGIIFKRWVGNVYRLDHPGVDWPRSLPCPKSWMQSYFTTSKLRAKRCLLNIKRMRPSENHTCFAFSVLAGLHCAQGYRRQRASLPVPLALSDWISSRCVSFQRTE